MFNAAKHRNMVRLDKLPLQFSLHGFHTPRRLAVVVPGLFMSHL